MKNQSNNLRYAATKTVGKESITVNIRLNDECNNGHQDFAITADIYQSEKPRTDKNWLGGGCQHEVIAAAFPEFIPFIKLHLADYAGIPMYAVENGFYHLTNGFNSKSTNEAFKAEYCEYYRVKPAAFDTLKLSQNQTQFALNLMNLGILDQWKAEAEAAIKQLEDLTGLSFLNDSKKTQFHVPTAEEIADNENKVKQGYWTAEAEAQRAEKRKTAILANLEANMNKEIKKHTLEYEVNKEVFLKGGEKALKACIFYNHTKELSFNWCSSDVLPVDTINALIPTLALPKGVTANISKNK